MRCRPHVAALTCISHCLYDLITFYTTSSLLSGFPCTRTYPEDATLLTMTSVVVGKRRVWWQVRAWELRLGRVSETLAAWLGVQRRWMYLEAIFSCSDDLRQQLAQVGMCST